jgi:Cu/Ag efflux pump CusA
MSIVRLVIPLVVLCLATGVSFAQPPALDSASGRKVDLTVAQKQILYQSISNTQKNVAAPAGFRAIVGAQVPGGIVLVPVPATIADIMPQTKGLETAMVEGQVLLVEPRGMTVVAVIAQEL